MINSVSFCGGGNKTVAYQNNNKSVEKRCKYIGAAVGVGVSAANVIKGKSMISNIINDAVAQGMTKGKVGVSLGVGMLLGTALLAGVGALLGKGVGKIINHFKKPEAPKEA